MDYRILSYELVNDPLGRGYAGMSNSEVADDLNSESRFSDKESMTGDELFQQTDAAEFSALADNAQAMWVSFCGRAVIDPFASANVQFVQWVFGGDSTTAASLSAARRYGISRAIELEIVAVTADD